MSVECVRDGIIEVASTDLFLHSVQLRCGKEYEDLEILAKLEMIQKEEKPCFVAALAVWRNDDSIEFYAGTGESAILEADVFRKTWNVPLVDLLTLDTNHPAEFKEYLEKQVAENLTKDYVVTAMICGVQDNEFLSIMMCFEIAGVEKFRFETEIPYEKLADTLVVVADE